MYVIIYSSKYISLFRLALNILYVIINSSKYISLLNLVLNRVQEIYSKKLTSLRWSGAHWRKLFSTGKKMKKNTNEDNCSTGDFLKTV